jgi:hypothetical protein
MRVFPFLTIIAFLGFFSAGCEPAAKITVRTVDDSQRPVPDVTVTMSFEHNRNPNRRTRIKGVTDTNGEFTGMSKTSGHVNFGARKAGFYTTLGKPWDGGQEQGGRLRPWNPTITLIMRQIINPIPLAAAKPTLTTTNLVDSAGFDLLAGDWVKPNGRGTNTDLLFEWNCIWRANDNREGGMILKFPNSNDGVVPQPYSVGSELLLPHQAPLGGYESKPRTWRDDFAPGKRSYSDGRDKRTSVSYFFRVRTLTNEAGEVVSALYGKTDGEFFFHGVGDDGTGLEFTYYINPEPNNRNLEFDGKTNLFDRRDKPSR